MKYFEEVNRAANATGLNLMVSTAIIK